MAAIKQLQAYPVDVVGLDRASVRAKGLSEQFGHAWVIRRYTEILVFVGNREADRPHFPPNCKDMEMKAMFRHGVLYVG